MWDASIVRESGSVSIGVDSGNNCASQSASEMSGIPLNVVKRLIDFIPRETRRSLRLTCRSWCRAIDKVIPISRPAANVVPFEILLQIFLMLSPRDFDNARRTCSQWMRVSLNERLLESMLRRAGWWDSWLQDCQTQFRSSKSYEGSPVWRMSRRFATECILSGRKVNVERAGFLTTTVVDFSKLAQGQNVSGIPHSLASTMPTSAQNDAAAIFWFHISACGNYMLVTTGCKIYVYRLLNRSVGCTLSFSIKDTKNTDISLITSISCPTDVISATVDSSTSRLRIAALLRNRVGLVCDVVASDAFGSAGIACNEMEGSSSMWPMEVTSLRYYHNVCSGEDPPRSVAIYPGRRCVAFGSGAGIELHWTDEGTRQSCRKYIPMSQPSEILHFLPNRSETPTEIRLISSLAGPGLPRYASYKSSGKQNFQLFARWNPGENNNLSSVKATHCHHYRAIPVNDGMHILFIEPRTSLLCIGSDAPFGGPTSLTRALVCIPPFGKEPLEAAKDGLAPAVFAAGSDLSWGLRVVAAYGDRIVLYSVPLNVFNVIRRERERQGENVMGDSDLARDWFLDSERSQNNHENLAPNQNGDWEFLLSVSYRPTAMMWPFKIYGKEIGRMDNVVGLSLQASHGGARVWAFGSSGETSIVDVDTFTSGGQRAADIPCKTLSVGADGNVASAELVKRSESGLTALPSRKRNQAETRDDFSGQGSSVSPVQLYSTMLDGLNPSGFHGLAQAANVAAKRRVSFAARIVDFNIPELSTREGRWAENECACA
ncbi:hypothetical protein BBP40_005210 [Aspergillus hancockii]|nr:hypothetical protein BBP40_005210 [Aspergillus hancockii]